MFVRFTLLQQQPYIARTEEIESVGVRFRDSEGTSAPGTAVIRFKSGREIDVAHSLEELSCMIDELNFYYIGSQHTSPEEILASIDKFRAEGRSDIWIGVRVKKA